MKRLKKRIVSLALAASTALCAVPLTEGVSELFTAPVTASAASSGTWDNCSWSLDSAGKLTITGSGVVEPKWFDNTDSYAASATSKYPKKDDVNKVVIGSGITGISDCKINYRYYYNPENYTNYTTNTLYYYGFNGCTKLTSVTAPATF